MRSVALFILVFALPAFAASPTLYASRNASPDFTITTDNDDSCDIGTAPAATLLLPYFEVETANRGIDTLFTITNVSHLTTIAHVTVWTDWGYPVLTFNVPLTGYDVQSFSMYDIVVRGIAGARSGEECTMPGQMPPATAAAIRDALVNGRAASICDSKLVGSIAVIHRTSTTAIGYVTIDETSKCSSTLPTDPSYFANEILFDNILTGDYQTIDNTDGSNYSGGNPLVHIRAVPEGGTSTSKTNLPYTFYRRFSGANVDRRQPLPATFAARWIQGGSTSFSTSFKIWREGRTGPVTCATPPSSNGFLAITEIVRFDEHENVNTFYYGCSIGGFCGPFFTLPPTSCTSSSDIPYPPLNSPAGDTAGWMYFNLNSGTTTGGVNTQLHPTFGPRPSQNWVVVSMSGAGSAAGLFGIEYDATYLGNGCSAPVATTNGALTSTIGPAGGVLVCPKFDPACTPGGGAYTGTNQTP